MMGAPYATKKALKAAVGERFRYIETSFFGPEFKAPGDNTVVGPDPYAKRSWYATVTVDAEGTILKVK